MECRGVDGWMERERNRQTNRDTVNICMAGYGGCWLWVWLNGQDSGPDEGVKVKVGFFPPWGWVNPFLTRAEPMSSRSPSLHTRHSLLQRL